MKNKKPQHFSGNILRAMIQGLIVFAVFGFSVYAYAITYPSTQPNPVSGVVGLYVGKTAGAHNGNMGGYASANSLCAPVMTDSHICTPLEIINTYNHNQSAVQNEVGAVWLNSGAPANTTPAVNDCGGWKNGTLGFYGNVWSFDNNDYSGILPCAVTLPVACCK